MTTVYLIRHAEAEGNVYRRSQGQYDSLLTERAYQQLPCLAKRFADVPLDAVYASTLYRARHTAKAIADQKGLPVRVRSGLREINMGEWEDVTWAILPRMAPEKYLQWQTRPWECDVPQGECIVDTAERVLKELRLLARRHEGGTIAVVSHGCAIRGVLCHALGMSYEHIPEVGWGDNTCVSKLIFDGDQLRVEYWMDASHLPEELSTFASIGWTDRKKGAPESIQIWFRPYDPASADDRAFLEECAKQFYQEAYGSTDTLDLGRFIEETNAMSAVLPRAVSFGMLDEKPVALVRLNVCDTQAPEVGMVGTFCILKEYRGRGLSQQILGQAISVYRDLGKKWLCANVAAGNQRAQGFYHKYAFENKGTVTNENGAHYRMMKKIYVDTLEDEAADFILDEASE